MRLEQGGSYGSKFAEIKHAVGNFLAIIFVCHDTGRPMSADVISRQKASFLKHMENAKSLPDYGEVNIDVINELHKRAEETDWNDLNALRSLFNYSKALTNHID